MSVSFRSGPVARVARSFPLIKLGELRQAGPPTADGFAAQKARLLG